MSKRIKEFYDPQTNQYPYPIETDKHYLVVKKNKGIVFDKNYPYIDKSKSFRFKFKLVRILLRLIVFPLVKIRLGHKVIGKENLKEYKDVIKNGVISVCNHVHMWDYLGILRAIGDSKRPLYVLIISCFVNIFLDLLFVIGFKMGSMSVTMGVIGVAIATVMCQVLSAAIVLFMLMKSIGSYKLYLKEIRIDPDMLRRIISIGLPAGIQTTMYTISNMLIQTAINEVGKNATAAWAAYGKIDVLFWMTISSLGTAVTTFAGQNFGAGKNDRVHKSTRYAFVIAFIITLPLSTLLYFYGDIFLEIFVADREVIEVGIQMIKYLAPFYFTYIGVEVFSGVLRGMGTAVVPMLITLSGICVLRVAWILIAFPLNKTIETIEFSYPLTWITTTILFTIYYIYYTKKHRL